MEYEIRMEWDGGERRLRYAEPMLVADVLRDAGLSQDRPCGGHGRCGKCALRVTGELLPMTQTERDTLDRLHLPDGWRLSCLATVCGPTTIYYNTENRRLQGVAEGFSEDFLPGERDTRPGLGVAVDIGTTTVAAYLYDLTSGNSLGALCRANPQRAHGADVISRIEYALAGGGEVMREEIRNCLATMESELCGSSGVAREGIARRVITGNTTMLHLLTGTDPSPLAAAPFEIRRPFGEWEGETYYPRCISAYVGADITAAVLASGMCRSDATSLLIDVGTNGEMALWHDGKLTCCSTAAGPAFEGAGISCGALAVGGAISRVEVRDGALWYETIGGTEPIGVCGTGLIDAVAALLATGELEETGFLEEDAPIGASGLTLTRGDIRQVQLAKSAIRSGIDTLLCEAGIGYDRLDTLYLAGGFGSYLHPETCAAIGLFPREVLGKIRVIGNAAGAGAGMMLLSEQALAESEARAAQAVTLELSRSPVFMEKYVENMMF